MQANIPEWKPSRREKKIKEQPVPMYQPLPPEPQPDPLWEKHFQQAETRRLKEKKDELVPDREPEQHETPIIHDDSRVPEFREEFDEMKRIYTVIRRGALERLIAINDALRDFNHSQTSPDSKMDTKAAWGAYEKARADFEEFCADLDNPHVPGQAGHTHDHEEAHVHAGAQGPKWFTNGVTLKWASIQPKLVEGGFISGAKVIVRWAGGSHISSDSLP